jgi:hypothetical protein
MRFLRWAMCQSLLMRLALLIVVPAGGIAWISGGFALGEWFLVVVLLGLWGLLGAAPRRRRRERQHVETVFSDRGRTE